MTFHSGPQGPIRAFVATIETALVSFFPRGFLEEIARRSAQVVGLALAASAVVLLLSLMSYNHLDPSWNTANNSHPTNWLGRFGATLADSSIQGFGLAAYLVPIFLCAWAWSHAFGYKVSRSALRWFTFPFALVLLAGVLSALPIQMAWEKPLTAGGAIGVLSLENMQAIIPLPKTIWAMLYVVAGGCLFVLSLPLRREDLASFRSGVRDLADRGQEAIYGRPQPKRWSSDMDFDQAVEPQLGADETAYQYNDPDVIRQILTSGASAEHYIPDAERDDRVTETAVTEAPSAAPPHRPHTPPHAGISDHRPFDAPSPQPAQTSPDTESAAMDHDFAQDFQGRAYGQVRYGLRMGNEAVNWAGMTSFADITNTSHPVSHPQFVAEPPVINRPKMENQAPNQSVERVQATTADAAVDVAVSPQSVSQELPEQPSVATNRLEPERKKLTNSFVERLRRHEQQREAEADARGLFEAEVRLASPQTQTQDQTQAHTFEPVQPDESEDGFKAPGSMPAQPDVKPLDETDDTVFEQRPAAVVASPDVSFAAPLDQAPEPTVEEAVEDSGEVAMAEAFVASAEPPLAQAAAPMPEPTMAPNQEAVAPPASLGYAANAVDQQLGGALAANREKQIRIEKKAAQDRGPMYDTWHNPTVDYLDMPDHSHIVGLSEEAIARRIEQLENALADYNVKGEVLRARPGPVVTLFEFQPAPGTRISRIVSLSDDIKRAMASASCRIAVVPETTLIGIELPNKQRTPVNLRQIIDHDAFSQSTAALPLAMGIDISGQPVIGDLARCPHLLIAGTTGAGKSVSLNGMIMSMLYKLPPDQLKMIMIDPKMLELSIYDKIPHLLSPVVTDPRKAIVALKWAVREMEERYATMMTLQVRGIVDYNERIAKAKATGEVITREVQTGFNVETGKPEFEEQELPLKPMPYVVCIIDELADLMELAKKEIEGSLQRLTQMGRAAGIHVITATQRPSVDVITGVIKANIPSRVSLYVRSKTDSRIVLDEQGAEQLLRVGDMLYSAEGRRPSRVHSGFVSTEEVLAVVEHLKAQAEPEYINAIQDDGSEDGEGGGDLMGDFTGDDGSGGGDGDLYRQAVRIVCQDRRASTSYIQRKLQIGYNRAARLIEQMENEGIVGPADKVGRRDILVGEDD